jgi:hypothetical protein
MEEKMQWLRYIDDEHQNTSQHEDFLSPREAICNNRIPESMRNSVRQAPMDTPECGSYSFDHEEENGSDEEYKESEFRLIPIFYHTKSIMLAMAHKLWAIWGQQ